MSWGSHVPQHLVGTCAGPGLSRPCPDAGRGDRVAAYGEGEAWCCASCLTLRGLELHPRDYARLLDWLARPA